MAVSSNYINKMLSSVKNLKSIELDKLPTITPSNVIVQERYRIASIEWKEPIAQVIGTKNPVAFTNVPVGATPDYVLLKAPFQWVLGSESGAPNIYVQDYKEMLDYNLTDDNINVKVGRYLNPYITNRVYNFRLFNITGLSSLQLQEMGGTNIMNANMQQGFTINDLYEYIQVNYSQWANDDQFTISLVKTDDGLGNAWYVALNYRYFAGDFGNDFTSYKEADVPNVEKNYIGHKLSDFTNDPLVFDIEGGSVLITPMEEEVDNV